MHTHTKKTIINLGIERNFFNLIEVIYERCTAKSSLITESLNAFPSDVKILKKVHFISIQQCIWCSSQWNREEKEQKNMQIDQVKLSLFADDPIDYVEN